MTTTTRWCNPRRLLGHMNVPDLKISTGAVTPRSSSWLQVLALGSGLLLCAHARSVPTQPQPCERRRRRWGGARETNVAEVRGGAIRRNRRLRTRLDPTRWRFFPPSGSAGVTGTCLGTLGMLRHTAWVGTLIRLQMRHEPSSTRPMVPAPCSLPPTLGVLGGEGSTPTTRRSSAVWCRCTCCSFECGAHAALSSIRCHPDPRATTTVS